MNISNKKKQSEINNAGAKEVWFHRQAFIMTKTSTLPDSKPHQHTRGFVASEHVLCRIHLPKG